MSQENASAHINFRITPAAKERIVQAAEQMGVNLSQFICAAAERAATSFLQRSGKKKEFSAVMIQAKPKKAEKAEKAEKATKAAKPAKAAANKAKVAKAPKAAKPEKAAKAAKVAKPAARAAAKPAKPAKAAKRAKAAA